MIDTSPPGSWASIITYCTQIEVSDFESPLEAFERQLEANLAARRALRPARSQAALKGWAKRRAA